MIPTAFLADIRRHIEHLNRQIEKPDAQLESAIEVAVPVCTQYYSWASFPLSSAILFYDVSMGRLLTNGKQKKVAFTACIRKLIVILNAMVRDQRKWNENMA